MADKTKTTKQMIKVSIVAYIPAPTFDLESFKVCDAKIKKIEAFIREEATEVQRFAKDQVGRQYDIEQQKAGAKTVKTGTVVVEDEASEDAYTPITFPKSWATEEGEVTIERVIEKARLKASLSQAAWDELTDENRDAFTQEMIGEMGLLAEDAEEE